MNLGDSFPEEILRQILYFVDDRPSQFKASLTCRRWYRLLTDGNLINRNNNDIDDCSVRNQIEITQRRILDMNDVDRVDDTAVGRRLHRTELGDLDALIGFVNYVESGDRLILSGVDAGSIASMARLFAGPRIVELELRLFEDVITNLDTETIVEEYFPNLRRLIFRSGFYTHVELARPLEIRSEKLRQLRFVRIRPSAGFQLSPERLEYVSTHERFMWDLEYLSALPNFRRLIDLNVGSILFDLNSFGQLLRVIRDDLPQLVNFELDECSMVLVSDEDLTSLSRRSSSDDSDRRQQQHSLKRIGYLNFFTGPSVMVMIDSIARYLRVKLDKATLDFKAERHPSFDDIYELIRFAYRSDCVVDLRITDKATDVCQNWPPPPVDTAEVLRKLELVQQKSTTFIANCFNLGGATFSKLTDIRFDQCLGLDAAILDAIARYCPHLESLRIVPYDTEAHYEGVLAFVRRWASRKSRLLSIYWTGQSVFYCGDDGTFTFLEKLGMEIAEKRDELLKNDKRMEQYSKSDGNTRISIWETSSDKTAKPKALIYRDYFPDETKVERFCVP